jgi:hypothetical protein
MACLWPKSALKAGCGYLVGRDKKGAFFQVVLKSSCLLVVVEDLEEDRTRWVVSKRVIRWLGARLRIEFGAYPSHVRPVDVQRLHAGFVSSHLT